MFMLYRFCCFFVLDILLFLLYILLHGVTVAGVDLLILIIPKESHKRYFFRGRPLREGGW